MSHSVAERLVARHVRNLYFEKNITACTLGVDGGSVLLRNVDEFSPPYSATYLRLPVLVFHFENLKSRLLDKLD